MSYHTVGLNYFYRIYTLINVFFLGGGIVYFIEVKKKLNSGMELIKSQPSYATTTQEPGVTDSLSSQKTLFISNVIRMQHASIIKPTTSQQYLYSNSHETV